MQNNLHRDSPDVIPKRKQIWDNEKRCKHCSAVYVGSLLDHLDKCEVFFLGPDIDKFFIF
jgi:hypothetical protein